MKTLSQTSWSLALVFGLSGALVFGCAKKREASLPEDQVAGTFSIDELQSFQLKLKTTEVKKSAIKNEALLGSERNTVAFETQGIPERLFFLFRNLEIPAKTPGEIQVIFGIDRFYVTAYKVARAEDLTAVENSLALSKEGLKNKITIQKLKINQKLVTEAQSKMSSEKDTDKTSSPALSLVPIFKFKVTAHGTIEKVKNDLKEETSVLKLKKSEWESSTHVQISDLSHERLNVEIDPAVAVESENYLITEKLQEKTFSKVELTELLGTEITGADSQTYKVNVDVNSVKVLPAQTTSQEASKKEVVLTLKAEQMDAQLNLEKGQESNVITFKKSDNKVAAFTKLVKQTPAK